MSTAMPPDEKAKVDRIVKTLTLLGERFGATTEQLEELAEDWFTEFGQTAPRVLVDARDTCRREATMFPTIESFRGYISGSRRKLHDPTFDPRPLLAQTRRDLAENLAVARARARAEADRTQGVHR